MINKIVYPDANEALFEACEGSMAKIVLNTEKSIKEASSNSITKKMLEDCRPDKDHFLIHFIGVGDYEKYGFNKNADAFPKKANEKYYDTFVKNGHLFREHKSDNPEVNAIGQIKKAMYNPEMGRIELAVWANIKKASEEYEKALAGETLSCSMGCFPAGTPVAIALGKEVAIETLKKGDTILTASTAISKVEDTYNYNYTGDLLTIKATGILDALVCTGNHPIYIRRYKKQPIQDAPAICPICGKHVKYLKTHIKRSLDPSHKTAWDTYMKEFEQFEEKFIDASELRCGDYIISPKFKLNTLSTDYDKTLAKFLGYFVAEGNFIKYRGKNIKYMEAPYRAVQLNFNKTETEYVNNVINLLKILVPNKTPTVQVREKKNLSVISLYDKDFANLVYNLCNEHADNKYLNLDLIKTWDSDCVKLFLNAYIEGDGTFNEINNNISWTTISKKLHQQLITLCNSIDLPVSTYTKTAYTTNGVLHKASYTGTIAQKDLANTTIFTKVSKDLAIVDLGLQHPNCFATATNIYHRITNINCESVTEFPVYNLNVAGEHTYIANNVLVHNCSVPVDRDSISGKLCKRPSEYEPWMKKTPGQYIPEHKKYAFVYNDEPSFFDLSIVKRPAERIAHYLEYKFASDNTEGLLKAASDNNGYIPSALLAELQGIKFSLTKGFRNIKKANTLKRLIELEKDFANAISDKQDNTVKGLYIKNAAINSFSKDFDLSDSELKEFTNLNIRKESFFREMAKRASIMNFKSFIDFIYPEDKSEEKQQAVKLASCQILPTLFNGLNNFGIDLNELDNLFDSGSEFDCIADNSNSDPIQKLFDKASDKFSIDKNGRDKRIISITIINNGGSTSANNILEDILPTILKTASSNSNNYSKEVINKAKKYATAYAVYKIAAINDIEKLQGKELDEATLLSLIGQNYIYNI